MYKMVNAMRTILLAAMAAACLCAQSRTQLNDGEFHGDPPFLLEDGWKPLLNGRDLAGWKSQDGAHEWFTTKAIRWERLLGPSERAHEEYCDRG
jgi:hypothetical protein